MIKVGIIGSYGCIYNDLLRILIKHPDVDLRWFANEDFAEAKLSRIFHSLIGETECEITASANLDDIDVLFVGETTFDIDRRLADYPDLKVIALNDATASALWPDPADRIYGLPEFNRKAMVRGGRHVQVPTAYQALIELALLPLAKNLLLNAPVNVTVFDPWTGADDVFSYRRLDPDSGDEAVRLLQTVQTSFAQTIDLSLHRRNSQKCIQAFITTDVPVDAAQALELYNDCYCDHRFTYAIAGVADRSYVEHTNKCMIGLSGVKGRLLVTAAIDEHYKGCAGTAVHCMNLMCGLLESTGF